MRTIQTLLQLVVIVLAIPATIIVGPIVAAIHVALHLAPAERGAAESPPRHTDPGVR